jgi:hypothetical protein
MISRKSYNHYYDEDDNDDMNINPIYSSLNEEDDEDEDISDNINEDKLKNTIDDEKLLECFSDARMSTKGHGSTTMKKKKKDKIIYNIGDKVVYRKKKASVLFGPYEKNYKQIYEIQMEDGTVTSAISTSLKKG